MNHFGVYGICFINLWSFWNLINLFGFCWKEREEEEEDR